jgi:solute carrier family 50 protein (sugar transporter)
LIYSYLIGNFFPLFSVCAFQTASAIVFGVVYWWWCTTRRRFYVLWGVTVAGVVLISIYAAIAVAGVTHQSEHQVEQILGYLCVVMNLILKVAPLETLKLIIRTKNASSMPVTMSIVAFVNGLLWVWTSALEDDMYVLTTNAAGAALGGVQIIVYVIYRPGKVKDAAPSPAPGCVDSEHPRAKSEPVVVYDLETEAADERAKSAVFVEARSPL